MAFRTNYGSNNAFTQHEIFHIGIFTFWHVHWFATCAFGKSLYYRGHTASTVSHKRPFEDRTAILPNCYHTFHWTCLKPPAIVYAMLNWQQALRVKAQSKCWDEDTRLGPAAQTGSRPRSWGQCCRTQCMAQWVRWASKGCPQCGTSEAGGPCRRVGLRFGTTAFPLMPLWWHRETHLHSAIQRLTPQTQSSTATAPENNSADTFLQSLTCCQRGRRGWSLTCLSERDTWKEEQGSDKILHNEEALL